MISLKRRRAAAGASRICSLSLAFPLQHTDTILIIGPPYISRRNNAMKRYTMDNFAVSIDRASYFVFGIWVDD